MILLKIDSLYAVNVAVYDFLSETTILRFDDLRTIKIKIV